MGIYFKATSVIGIQIIPHNQDQEADLHQQFSIVVRHLIAWNSFFSENTRFNRIKEATNMHYNRLCFTWLLVSSCVWFE